MSQWVWTYFTFTRGARLITGDQRLPGWQEHLNTGPEVEEDTRATAQVR
jgi:NADH:ubiquinone reductase (H+-translocating)